MILNCIVGMVCRPNTSWRLVTKELKENSHKQPLMINMLPLLNIQYASALATDIWHLCCRDIPSYDPLACQKRFPQFISKRPAGCPFQCDDHHNTEFQPQRKHSIHIMVHILDFLLLLCFCYFQQPYLRYLRREACWLHFCKKCWHQKNLTND